MAIVFNDNLMIKAGKPVDDRYLNVLSPYTSINQVNVCIPESYRYTGLTVNVGGVEYWYKNGITYTDLVKKSLGGTITGATNGLHLNTDGTVVSLGGILTGDTYFESGRVSPAYTLRYYDNYHTSYNKRSLVDKEYVDVFASGLKPREAVKVASTGDTILSGLQTIDGYVLQHGDRVLLKNQINKIYNGIYSAATGSWNRTPDYDNNLEVVSGSYVWVLTGNTNNNTAWVQITENPVVGLSGLTFVLFNNISDITEGVGINIIPTPLGKQIDFDGGSVAGTCLSWNGTQLNVNPSIISINNESITGVTNGLTKYDSHNICLGGALISGSSTMLTLPYASVTSFTIGEGNESNWHGGRIVINRDNVNIDNNVSYFGARHDNSNYSKIKTYSTSGITFNSYIAGSSHSMCLGISGLTYGACYHSEYNNRTLVDKEYVDDCVCSGVNAGNGLTKVGSTITLGGVLTGNTTITGNHSLNVSGGAKLNTTCGYQISGNTILKASTNTISSIYIGNQSGNNGTGSNNFGVGYKSLSANTSGSNNIGVGYQSLAHNISGISNIGIGWQTLYSNTYGIYNIAIGDNSLYGNISGFNNIGLGSTVLYCNTTGTDNIAFGLEALYSNVNGNNNIAQGQGALTDNISGSENIALGINSLYINSIGSYNLGVGSGTLYFNSVGNCNIALGYSSLCNNETGNDNISIGKLAGCSNVTGSSSVYIGRNAGYYETESNKLHIANCNACSLIYGDFATNIVTLPTLKLCNTPTTGDLIDNFLVWDASTCCVKQLAASLFSSGITFANNGLTKESNLVVLGGNLLCSTSINLNTYDLCFTSTSGNTYGLAKFGLNDTYANSNFNICSRDPLNACWSISSDCNSVGLMHCENTSNGSSIYICNSNIGFYNKNSSSIKSLSLNSSGLTYGNCYHSAYINRSLVDKEYVDKRICDCSNISNVCNIGITYTTTYYDDFVGVSGSSCIYLISSPRMGQKVTVADICGNAQADPIYVDGNGICINAGACSCINTNYGAITFIYRGSMWSAIAFVN